MFYTKSLFVNFSTSPHLARRAIHDKKWVYQQILDAKYGAMDGLAIGEEVEQAALQLYDADDVVTVDTRQLNFSRWHESFHEQTMTLLEQEPNVLYQPAFVFNDLFCKCDLLVRNAEWQYDLYEIKAKNSVRKKTKAEPLLDDMLADMSFQHYVLSHVLGDKFSGKCYFLHLDKEYVRQWSIVYKDLIKQDDVSSELMQHAHLEMMLETLRKLPDMNKGEVDNAFPYNGDDHLTYFGTLPEKWSIWMLPRARRQLPDLYDAGYRAIDDIPEEAVMDLYSAKGEPTKLSQYIELWKQWEETIVHAPLIRQQLDNLTFPLYFYDYETVSVPVPVFEWSSPWQQVVVQYSCHKMESDGTITHTEAIIKNGENDNRRVIEQLIHDLGQWIGGTYIVRYKGFENSRNKELAAQYPEFEDALLAVNENTFDLMEVFSTLNYFDRRFNGSSSIKKVLPVLTDISYDNLTVSNGAIAASLLWDLAKGKVIDDEKQVISDLLTYCEQDTWAMVKIYEVVKGLIDK